MMALSASSQANETLFDKIPLKFILKFLKNEVMVAAVCIPQYKQKGPDLRKLFLASLDTVGLFFTFHSTVYSFIVVYSFKYCIYLYFTSSPLLFWRGS